MALEGDDRGKTDLAEGGTVKVATAVEAGRFLATFVDVLGLPAS